jgi:hypothetical protein
LFEVGGGERVLEGDDLGELFAAGAVEIGVGLGAGDA